MIEQHVIKAGVSIGEKISKVVIINGISIGCLDTYLIKFYNNNKSHNIIIPQKEYDNIVGGGNLDLLEKKIKAALQKSL